MEAIYQSADHSCVFFSYWVSATPLFLGFIWILFDRERQGWHDKLADTHVIYTHSRITNVYNNEHNIAVSENQRRSFLPRNLDEQGFTLLCVVVASLEESLKSYLSAAYILCRVIDNIEDCTAQSTEKKPTSTKFLKC